jgi:HK97 family phage major capsid protein
MDEIKKIVEAIQKEWEQFKSENDRRLKEIAAKGHADPLTEEKIDKHSAAIGDLQKQLTEVEKKAGRAALGATSQVDEQKQAHAEHRKTFVDGFLRKGETSGLEELQRKALSLGVNADGGFAAPQDLDRAIYEVQLKYTPMRECCTVITVSNEKYEQLVNIHGLSGGWVSETGARAATNTPQFAQFKPLFGELYANATASQRVLDDAFFNLETHVASEIGKTFGLLENAEFTNGAGVAGTSPKGCLAYTPSAAPVFGTNIGLVKSGTAGTITADTLFDVMPKILKGYRNGANWMGAVATFTAIRKLKDSQNRYLWEPSMQAGVPPQLLGYAIVENEDMPAVAASANVLLFGNFKQACVIADVVGTRFLRDPYTNKPNVMFYATKRVAHGVRDTSALVAYQLAV